MARPVYQIIMRLDPCFLHGVHATEHTDARPKNTVDTTDGVSKLSNHAIYGPSFHGCASVACGLFPRFNKSPLDAVIKRDTTMLVPNEKSFVSRRNTSSSLFLVSRESRRERIEFGRERIFVFLHVIRREKLVLFPNVNLLINF